MAQLAVAAAGSLVGPPQAGWLIGSAVGGLLFREERTTEGPRLGDLQVQASTYGAGIPEPWGAVRLAGNVIWAQPLLEQRREQGGGQRAGSRPRRLDGGQSIRRRSGVSRHAKDRREARRTLMPSADSAWGLGLEPIPENLFREPVEYLFAEHYRQLVAATIVGRLAEDPDSGLAPSGAAVVLDYLRDELPRHVADEEECLVPLLRLRCMPGDDVAGILKLLLEEHARDGELLVPLIAGLSRLAARQPLTDAAAFIQTAAACAEGMRRHLAWENAVLLPLARKRLSRSDMVEFGRRMADRRGVAYPDERAGRREGLRVLHPRSGDAGRRRR